MDVDSRFTHPLHPQSHHFVVIAFGQKLNYERVGLSSLAAEINKSAGNCNSRVRIDLNVGRMNANGSGFVMV